MPNDPALMEPQASRRRGRPVQMAPEDREVRLLDCAIALLSERGADDVTMTDIARRAGMSKRTLYDLYRSREELLGAALRRIGETLFRPLHPDERNASLEERLRILLTFSSDMNAPELPIEILRVIIAKVRSFPELGQSLSRRGPGHVIELLRDELIRAAEMGEIDIAHEEIGPAAELLVDMVFGNTIHSMLDPDRILRHPEERAARRDRAVAIFLNGLRPR